MRAFLFCLVSARCFPGLCPNRPRGIGVENLRAGEEPRLGFVCPAKKPRNIYRANGALRLFVLPIFGFCPWKIQQAALPRIFAKRNGYTQQTLSRQSVFNGLARGTGKIRYGGSRTFQIYRRYKNAKSRGQRACKQYAIFICVFWRCPAQRGLCYGVPV